MSAQIYYLTYPALNISIPTFNSSVANSICGNFIYTITNNGVALNTSIFTINSTAPSLSVNTTYIYAWSERNNRNSQRTTIHMINLIWNNCITENS